MSVDAEKPLTYTHTHSQRSVRTRGSVRTPACQRPGRRSWRSQSGLYWTFPCLWTCPPVTLPWDVQIGTQSQTSSGFLKVWMKQMCIFGLMLCHISWALETQLLIQDDIQKYTTLILPNVWKILSDRSWMSENSFLFYFLDVRINMYYLDILSGVCLHFTGSSCGLEIFSAAAIGQPERLRPENQCEVSFLTVHLSQLFGLLTLYLN